MSIFYIVLFDSVGSIETELSDDKKKDVNLSRQNLTELPEK